MNQTYIRDVSKHVGEEVTLKGWLYNMRSSGKLMFPQVRDGSGIIQGVVFKVKDSQASTGHYPPPRPGRRRSKDILPVRVRSLLQANHRQRPHVPGSGNLTGS